MNHYEPSVLAPALYQADGQILDEVYEYDSFLQSKMYANHVQCTDCHDPHSLKLKYEGNNLCTQCHEPHNPAKYDTPAHHHHAVGSEGAKCISCHMASRMYMVIDERRDHSFRLPRPDLSVELGTSNACNKCHTKPNETPQWAADAIKKWYGERPKREPHWGPAIKAGQKANLVRFRLAEGGDGPRIEPVATCVDGRWVDCPDPEMPRPLPDISPWSGRRV